MENTNMNNNTDNLVPVVPTTRAYTIEKIVRSCDRSISVNYQTYKVSTSLSATVSIPNPTEEEIKQISAEIYRQAEEQTLSEINKIREALRG